MSALPLRSAGGPKEKPGRRCGADQAPHGSWIQERADIPLIVERGAHAWAEIGHGRACRHCRVSRPEARYRPGRSSEDCESCDGVDLLLVWNATSRRLVVGRDCLFVARPGPPAPSSGAGPRPERPGPRSRRSLPERRGPVGKRSTPPTSIAPTRIRQHDRLPPMQTGQGEGYRLGRRSIRRGQSRGRLCDRAERRALLPSRACRA